MKKETQTLSQVIERLDRLEKSIAKLNQQLSLLVDAVVTSKQKNFKTGEGDGILWT